MSSSQKLAQMSNERGARQDSFLQTEKGICSDCLDDIFSPFSRRFRYPYTACTTCHDCKIDDGAIKLSEAGEEIPASVAATMCDLCKQEFLDQTGRRYQFVNNSCHACGAKTVLVRNDGRAVCIDALTQLDDVDAATSLLQKGEVVALKDSNGYHLACDATNDAAVQRLRAVKQKVERPLVLVSRDLQIIEQYCVVNEEERTVLMSAASPIVILEGVLEGKARKKISPLIAPGLLNYAMALPDTALMCLLLKRMNRPVALTRATLQETKSVDYFLSNKQPAVGKNKRSIVRVVSDRRITLRPGRGLAPLIVPFPDSFKTAEAEAGECQQVLASGVDAQTTFCIVKENCAYLSSEFSDLAIDDCRQSYSRQIASFKRHITSKSEIISASDLDSELISSLALAEKVKTECGEKISERIQRHHAHIVSCMIDNDWQLTDGPVLGVALGGIGQGDDETQWGGEFLLSDYTSYNRFATFKPVPLFNGEWESRKPWVCTYAHLLAEMGWARYQMDFEELELTGFFESKDLPELNEILKDGKKSPLVSSCTILFDAMVAALGINREKVHYQNQSSLLLEALVDHKTLVDETEELAYPFQVPRLPVKGIPYVEPLAMWQAVLGDLLLNTHHSVMSARFHKGLAKTIAYIVKKLCTRDEERWLNTVALSGPIFENIVLATQVKMRLEAMGFAVLTHREIPSGPAGIALGQAAIAAARNSNRAKRT